MMRKIKMLILLLIFTSCEKVLDSTLNKITNPPKIEISFKNTPTSRAFGSGTTEVWEKSIGTATILVFNSAGDKVYQRTLSGADAANIEAAPISFVLIDAKRGDKLDFIVIANRNIPSNIMTKSALVSLLESDVASYNGTFAEVSTQAKRSGGFAMSGITQATITDGTTSVAITLKRVVAKLEVKSASTAAFASKYGNATITVTNIVVTKGNSKSYLIPNTTLHANDKAFTFTQPSSAGNNLFYVFEQPSIGVGSRITLTINAIYDADGLSTTAGDQVPVVYTVEVNGQGGMVGRNNAYLVNVHIDGLNGTQITIKYTIVPWKSIVTDFEF